MLRIVYDYIHEPVKKRVQELCAEDPTIGYEPAYSVVLEAVESGAVSLSDLPDLTLQPKEDG